MSDLKDYILIAPLIYKCFPSINKFNFTFFYVISFSWLRGSPFYSRLFLKNKTKQKNTETSYTSFIKCCRLVINLDISGNFCFPELCVTTTLMDFIYHNLSHETPWWDLFPRNERDKSKHSFPNHNYLLSFKMILYTRVAALIWDLESKPIISLENFLIFYRVLTCSVSRISFSFLVILLLILWEQVSYHKIEK